jgi:hypothetical protein
MYGIYFEGQRVAKTPRFQVIPSGALECRSEQNTVEMVLAAGSWDTVVWEEGLA